MQSLEVHRYREIVFLTGAGISVASGLQPYRGPGGLWEQDERVAHLATAEALDRDPAAVWGLFGSMRDAVRQARPNPAHHAIAAVAREAQDEGRRVTVITQNVDGLHQRAGTPEVIALHGSLLRTRCTSDDCPSEPFDDSDPHAGGVPLCEQCGAPLRPDIVLFNEPIGGGDEWRAKRRLRDCDLFIAVGTSGTVSPAANFVRSAAYAGARTILVNLEPMHPLNPVFQEQYLGKAEHLLPVLLDQAPDAARPA